MGRVPNTGSAKLFYGQPFSIPDLHSVYYAVSGTSGGQILNRDFKFLVSRSNLDMFVPKRIDYPIAASQYKGYPQLTLNLDLLSTSAYPEAPDSQRYTATIGVRLNTNSRVVGYTYRVFVEVFDTDNGFILPAPDEPEVTEPLRYDSHTFEIQPGNTFNQQYVFSLKDFRYNTNTNTGRATIRITYLEEIIPGTGFESGLQHRCYLKYPVPINDSNEIQIPEASFPDYKELSYDVIVSDGNPTRVYPSIYTLYPVVPLELPTSNWCTTYEIAGDSFDVFTAGGIPAISTPVSLNAFEMVPVDYGWYRVDSLDFPSGTFYIVQVALEKSTGASRIYQVSDQCSINGPQQ
jgi:hypothetical protein